MPSQFFGLHIGYSGLNAAQASLNTAANNVSNVKTTGYSKQVTNLSESYALRAYAKYGAIGTGVSADSVTRLRDVYYDKKYRTNQSYLGYYDRLDYYMGQIEDYFTDNTANPGFTTIFTKMFNALDSVQGNAGDTSVRNTFISDAQELCSYFNTMDTQLSTLQSTVNDEIKSTVDTINADAKKIALLNKQINQVEQQGGHANELRDQRDLVLDELSKIVDIDVEEHDIENSNFPDMDTGATYLSVKINGQFLVDNYEYNSLSVKARDSKYNQSDIEGLYDVVWTSSGNDFSVWGDNQKGTLKALFEIRDGNDEQNLRGMVTDIGNTEADGSGATTITISHPNSANTTVDGMNLPETGIITINNVHYEYTDFKAQTGADGNIVSYTFTVPYATDTGKMGGQTATIGQSVDYKGIPYYQNQMNSFCRAFARAFNQIEKTGQDLNGDAAGSFFTINDRSQNREGDFSATREVNDIDTTLVDANYYSRVLLTDSDGNPVDEKGVRVTDDDGKLLTGKKYTYYYTNRVLGAYDSTNKIWRPTDKDGNYITDNDGKLLDGKSYSYYYYTTEDLSEASNVINDQMESEHALYIVNNGKSTIPDGYSEDTNTKCVIEDASNTNVTYGFLNPEDDNYYRMTASNIQVSSELQDDPAKFAATIRSIYNSVATGTDQGQDAADLISALEKLQSDTVIYKSGGADEFLQRVYADVTVDKNESSTLTSTYTNIKSAISKQRQSVSGVDEDEEALDLVKFQQAYNLAAKVISVMAEVYDQLILNTGV